MMRSNIKKIIVKYMDSDTTAEEEAMLLKWLQSGENREFFKRYVKTESLIKSQSKRFDEDKAFKDFLFQIRKGKRTAKISRLLKYTAVFVGILLMTGLMVFNNKDAALQIDPNAVTLEIHSKNVRSILLEGSSSVIRVAGKELGSLQPGSFIYSDKIANNKTPLRHTLKVPYGKKFQVTLTDGTIVHLNSGSVLGYPANFEPNGNREVYLEGEAFFDVSENKHSPFIVNTQGLQTQVFGTEFNISAYTDDEIAEVVLVEGEVGVRSHPSDKGCNGNLTRLTPNQKATMGYKKQGGITVSNVDAAAYTLWRKGILRFESDDMVSIIKKLERHFNLTIVNNCPALDTRLFTGTFDIESAEEILGVIQAHTPFAYTKSDKTIIINTID
ncbi:FecR domain-containing protein [Flavobacteriaceae bacterium 3-367]